MGLSQYPKLIDLEVWKTSKIRRWCLVAKCVYQLVHHCHCSKILLFIWLEVSTCFLVSMNWTWWQVGLKPSTFLDSRITTASTDRPTHGWWCMGFTWHSTLKSGHVNRGGSCHLQNQRILSPHTFEYTQHLAGLFYFTSPILCLQLDLKLYLFSSYILSDIYMYYLWGCWFTPSFFV